MLATINHGDVPSKQAADINKNFEELSGGGSGGLPVGVENQLLTWDESGSPVASTLNPNMWSPVPATAIPVDTFIVPTALYADGELAAQNYLFASPLLSVKGLVLRDGDGTIKASPATETDDVVNLAQLNRTPTATVRGGVLKGSAVANCTVAADGTSVGTQFNALLVQLRAAGIIA